MVQSSRGGSLVTGGSGGIGTAICRQLAAGGSPVSLSYRNRRPDALLGELSATGVDVRAEQLDLDDVAAIQGWVTRSAEAFRGIHTVVHAAGPHVPMIHMSRVSPDQFAGQLHSDVGGFFNLVHVVLPLLRESSGSLTAVTTAATSRFPVRDGLSSGPKAAVESLVRAFAAEEGRFGVRFNCVGPGMLTDGMAERLISSGDLDDHALDVARNNIPLRTFGRAEDIAEAVCFLASDKAKFITGQKLDIDGGYGI